MTRFTMTCSSCWAHPLTIGRFSSRSTRKSLQPLTISWWRIATEARITSLRSILHSMFSLSRRAKFFSLSTMVRILTDDSDIPAMSLGTMLRISE